MGGLQNRWGSTRKVWFVIVINRQTGSDLEGMQLLIYYLHLWRVENIFPYFLIRKWLNFWVKKPFPLMSLYHFWSLTIQDAQDRLSKQNVIDHLTDTIFGVFSPGNDPWSGYDSPPVFPPTVKRCPSPAPHPQHARGQSIHIGHKRDAVGVGKRRNSRIHTIKTRSLLSVISIRPAIVILSWSHIDLEILVISCNIIFLECDFFCQTSMKMDTLCDGKWEKHVSSLAKNGFLLFFKFA